MRQLRPAPFPRVNPVVVRTAIADCSLREESVQGPPRSRRASSTSRWAQHFVLEARQRQVSVRRRSGVVQSPFPVIYHHRSSVSASSDLTFSRLRSFALAAFPWAYAPDHRSGSRLLPGSPTTAGEPFAQIVMSAFSGRDPEVVVEVCVVPSATRSRSLPSPPAVRRRPKAAPSRSECAVLPRRRVAARRPRRVVASPSPRSDGRFRRRPKAAPCSHPTACAARLAASTPRRPPRRLDALHTPLRFPPWRPEGLTPCRFAAFCEFAPCRRRPKASIPGVRCRARELALVRRHPKAAPLFARSLRAAASRGVGPKVDLIRSRRRATRALLAARPEGRSLPPGTCPCFPYARRHFSHPEGSLP
jgi:hypothetical protein